VLTAVTTCCTAVQLWGNRKHRGPESAGVQISDALLQLLPAGAAEAVNAVTQSAPDCCCEGKCRGCLPPQLESSSEGLIQLFCGGYSDGNSRGGVFRLLPMCNCSTKTLSFVFFFFWTIPEEASSPRHIQRKGRLQLTQTCQNLWQLKHWVIPHWAL
jgi:hypothetical protein